MNISRTVTDDIYNLIDPDTLQNYDETEEIRFSPPAYIQRYDATSDVLMKYEGRLKKVRYHINILPQFCQSSCALYLFNIGL